jgi:hypothetical protein
MSQRCEKTLSKSELDYGFIRVRHRRELFPARDFSLEFRGKKYTARIGSQSRLFGLGNELHRICKEGDVAIIEKQSESSFALRIKRI